MPYRSGVFVLDPSVLEMQETDATNSKIDLNLTNDKYTSQ